MGHADVVGVQHEARPESRLDAGVAAAGERRGVGRRVHLAGAGRGDHALHGLLPRAVLDLQRLAPRRELTGEIVDRRVDERGARPVQQPVVECEQVHDRALRAPGRLEHRVVVEAEIAPVPGDDGIHPISFARPHATAGNRR